MSAMQDLEEYLKECTAYVLAKNYGTDPTNYLNYNNFKDKKTRNEKFKLSNILNSINNNLTSIKEPIKHYATEYNVVPPWILLKSVYFSTIVNFLRCFKRPQKVEIANMLYNSLTLKLNEDQLVMLMHDTLSLCMDYRNCSAHGGRIYNYISDSNIRVNDIFPSNFLNMRQKSNIGMLLRLLSLLNYQDPFISISNTLNQEINRHCSNYPQDKDYLSNVLDIEIKAEIYVYKSKNSTICHNDINCSGLKSPIKMLYENAIKRGLTPCKKCIIPFKKL